MSKITHIRDLILDDANARRHGPRNIGMIVDSLHEIGAARSIVIDEDGRILAGNGTIEAAAEAGIERVQVVDADGETIVAVRRSGLTDAQKLRLALLDNRTAELADWDPDVLGRLAADGAVLDDLFTEEELSKILGTVETEETEDRSEYPQATQLRPAREYVVIVCDEGEDGEEQFSRLQSLLSLGTVRRGGYKPGSQFDELGTERVVQASRFLEAVTGGGG